MQRPIPKGYARTDKFGIQHLGKTAEEVLAKVELANKAGSKDEALRNLAALDKRLDKLDDQKKKGKSEQTGDGVA